MHAIQRLDRHSKVLLARALGAACAVLVIASAFAGCGEGSRSQPAPRRSTRLPAASTVSAQALTGTWQWTLTTDEGGARRVEHEVWQLSAEDGKLTGRYDRVATFLSLDGVPFVCNQALSYEQRSTYTLAGQYHGRTIEVREVSYQAAPSPCDEGYRTLASYHGTMRNGQLVLDWPSGTETLVRAPAGTALASPEPADPAATATPAGAWRWQSRNERRGEVTVEVEDWNIAENSPGELSGTVQRTVTVFDADGRRFACNGETFYRYVDRYTWRGQRTGATLSVQETAVEVEHTSCLDRSKRHLDAATGELQGSYLVLVWRGNRRQILHRPAAINPLVSEQGQATVPLTSSAVATVPRP